MNAKTDNRQIKIFSSLLLALCVSLTLSADPVKKERKVDRFTGIKVGGAFNVVLTQANGYKLVVEAEEDLHDDITTEVKGDVLHIEMDWNWKWKNNVNITIYIDFEELKMLDVSGAADVRSENKFNLDDLELEVSGAGDIDLEVKARSMEVRVSGAGDIRISGETDEQHIVLSGAGDYKAGDLKSNYTHAKASGAGNITVYASQEIEAQASGAGSVKYYGNPQKERTHASGAGSIRRAD